MGVEDDEMQCRVCDDNEQEEARGLRIAGRPYTPTKAEIDAHFPLHAEYRSWCRFCVEGKAVSRPHYAKDPEEEQLGITISCDYCFWTPEEREEEMDALLVAYDSAKCGLWVLPAECKGATESSVTWLHNKIENSGYNGVKITMKSDQEESIKHLKKAVSVKRTSETAMIESPVRVSKANGQIERAIRTWQAQFRTLRLQLEHRIGEKISKGTPIMSWLINFQVLNLRQPLVAQLWDGLNRILEPLYRTIRRVLPPMSGIDFAPLVALIGVYALRIILANNASFFF